MVGNSKMRATGLMASLLFVLLVAGTAAAQGLPQFAAAAGLRDVDGFVDAVDSLRRNHQLPSRFVGKAAAEAHGWHGGGLCTAWPGHAIGGDVFHDAGAPLPKASGRVYREADVDADCKSRGPKRLIFSNDGLIFLSVDHYKSFTPVP